MDNGENVTPQGTRRKCWTTKGWHLLVEWKDGGSDWVPLKDMKEAFPVQTAEYAVANKIAKQPAFAWWIRHALKTRDRMIKKVKSRYWKRSHKYGVELPKSVKEAMAADAKSGTTFWKDAIEKEMKNVLPAFEFRDDDKMPIGHQKIDCHMIFNIKLDLVRKAQFVAGGHQTEVPSESVYSSYVSTDSVRIAFLIAALNDLDILAADPLERLTKERLYTIAGPEFGPAKVGRPVLIVRALYGLRSSGARFHDHMAANLREGGYTACKADADVWMKAAVKKDGTPYYKYVFCYCDNILAISEDPKVIMEFLKTTYTLKNNSVAEPAVYLGAKVSKHYLTELAEPNKPRWSLSAEDYVKRAVKDVETELDKAGKFLPTKVTTPCTTDYCPKLDQSMELGDAQASYYAGLIGVLWWCIEPGRIDIMVEVSLLSHKLRMMVVHFEGPTSVFCDNEGVVKNTTLPESPLKKKHVAICYHRCREAQAAGFVQSIRRRTSPTRSRSLCRASEGGSCCKAFCGEGFLEPRGRRFSLGLRPRIRSCFFAGTRDQCLIDRLMP
jgi:hypothetical protein